MSVPVLVSSKHKLVGVPYNEAIKNLYPKALEHDFDGIKHLLVPHTPIETFILRKHGFDCPSPILTHYDWPGSKTPFDVQKKTCALLTTHQRAFCLNGMGTGKTSSALWSYDYLRSNGLCKRALVLAPLSTLNFTWAREIFATLPGRKAVVLHGAKKTRLERLADPDADIFVLNHDGVKVIEKELTDMLKSGEIDTIIIDELAVYRNGGAQRTKVLRKLAALAQWVWGLTGSPIPTSPTDAWAQCSIVQPANVPKYFGQFRDQLMTKVSTFKWVPKSDAVDRAFSVMQPAVRFTLEDVVELPECIERTVDVELGPAQKKIYKDIADSCYSAVQSEEITAANAGAMMMKLLQISTGWVYAKGGEVVALDNDKRVEALIDAVNATDRKALVFVPFKHALEGISAALTREGIDHACVDGDTPALQRDQIFNLFQNTQKYRVIAAHPQCLAHGITLTAADLVVWFAPVTSLEIYEQANARIRRVGQKYKQLYLHLQSTPVEKRIYQMLQTKQKVQSQLLDLFATATQLEMAA